MHIKLPTRTDAHRIDTLAVRTVIKYLHVDWLVRGLEERDYGVDIQLELFDANTPTGHVLYGQIKGQKKCFQPGDASFSFPVKTIEYACLFDQPFFVFLVSLDDDEVRFIWLQKYVEIVLMNESSCWRSQDTVTISFPEENVLVDKDFDPEDDKQLDAHFHGQKKIAGILNRRELDRAARILLRSESLLRLHKKGILSAQAGAIEIFSTELHTIRQNTVLKDELINDENKDGWEKLLKLGDLVDSICLGKTCPSDLEKRVAEVMALLEEMTVNYLLTPDLDVAMCKRGGYAIPY
nr:hypothetical protein HUO10_004826 [Paraburkholderia busanensis]